MQGYFIITQTGSAIYLPANAEFQIKADHDGKVSMYAENGCRWYFLGYYATDDKAKAATLVAVNDLMIRGWTVFEKDGDAPTDALAKDVADLIARMRESDERPDISNMEIMRYMGWGYARAKKVREELQKQTKESVSDENN